MFYPTLKFIFTILLFTACNRGAKTESPKQDSPVSASRDTVPATKTVNVADEHGCKAVDGEIWSIVRESCISLSETGIKLEPQDPALDKTKPAWLVFSDDTDRVEIILPTQQRPVIIRKTSAEAEPPRWSSGPLTVSLSNGTYSLDDDGKILYRGPATK